MFLNDLTEALGAHIGLHTTYNLLIPLCERAIKDGNWSLDKFIEKLKERFILYYECNVEDTPQSLPTFRDSNHCQVPSLSAKLIVEGFLFFIKLI